MTTPATPTYHLQFNDPGMSTAHIFDRTADQVLAAIKRETAYSTTFVTDARTKRVVQIYQRELGFLDWKPMMPHGTQF